MWTSAHFTVHFHIGQAIATSHNIQWPIKKPAIALRFRHKCYVTHNSTFRTPLRCIPMHIRCRHSIHRPFSHLSINRNLPQQHTMAHQNTAIALRFRHKCNVTHNTTFQTPLRCIPMHVAGHPDL
jgi:hypothetical protein